MLDTQTVRAMAIVAPRQTSAVTVPLLGPGSGEVRIRVDGCGVCASNLGPWLGLPWMQYPLEPGQGGHEAWGVVDALGPLVEGVAVGDRVAFLGDRGWAQAAIARADELVVLPEALWDRPFPGEAFACAANVARRSRFAVGEVVAIVGVGFLGAAVCRLAADAGATVIAVSRRDSSLALAEELGAHHAVRFGADAVGAVRALTGGDGCARVIEAVGTQGALDLASALCATRGTLVVAGYHQGGPRTVDLQSWNWRGLDVINAHERDPARYIAGLRDAIRHVLAGRWVPERLVTDVLPLGDLARALDLTAHKAEGFVKAVVVP